MSGLPSPGWPVIALGRKIYQEVHGQQLAGFGTVWWYNWFATVAGTAPFKQWQTAKRTANPFDIDLFAAGILAARGRALVEAEEENPATAQPADDYHFVPMTSTASGWSLWRGGQYDVPLPDSDWMQITGAFFSWAISCIINRTMGTRLLDLAVEYMVLPSPSQRALPLMRPPAGLQSDDVAQDAWRVWWKESGGDRPLTRYSSASARQFTALDAEYQRLSAHLGNVSTVLRYASLTEPLYRLQEKLDEFGSKRKTANAALKVMADNRSVAERVLTTAELRDWDETAMEVSAAETRLYRTLPPGVWDGERPTSMAGLGAWLLTSTITGVVAIGLLGSVAWAIATIDKAIARQRAMGQMSKLLDALDEDAAQAELIRQECRLSAEQETDAQRRRILTAQCDQDAQRTLTAIVAARNDATAAITAAAANRAQASGTENTGLYVLGALAAVGAYTWWQNR